MGNRYHWYLLVCFFRQERDFSAAPKECQEVVVFCVSFPQFALEQTRLMKKPTEMVLAWELWEQGMSKSAIARQQGRHRETIIIGIEGIEQYVAELPHWYASQSIRFCCC